MRRVAGLPSRPVPQHAAPYSIASRRESAPQFDESREDFSRVQCRSSTAPGAHWFRRGHHAAAAVATSSHGSFSAAVLTGQSVGIFILLQSTMQRESVQTNRVCGLRGHGLNGIISADGLALAEAIMRSKSGRLDAG